MSERTNERPGRPFDLDRSGVATNRRRHVDTVTPTLLVPLDLGREADRALPVARSLADAVNGRLEVVVVTDVGLGTSPEDDDAEVRVHARRRGVEVDAIRLIGGGDVVDALVAAASAPEGDALCVATHAWSPLADVVAHGVTGRVVARGVPAVLVGPAAVAPGATRRRRSVLACVDGTGGSSAVPAAAVAWGSRLGVEVQVLLVDDGHGDDTPARTVAQTVSAMRSDGVSTRGDVVEGHSPAEVILAVAAGMDDPLVVLGSRVTPHLAGFGAGTLRPVVRHVVQRAAVPVLVTPA